MAKYRILEKRIRGLTRFDVERCVASEDPKRSERVWMLSFKTQKEAEEYVETTLLNNNDKDYKRVVKEYG